MAKFRIICVGKTPKGWREEAFEHYRKLIVPFAKLEEISVKEQKIIESAGIENSLRQEGERILKLLSASTHKIALDRKGKHRSSIELCKHFETLYQRFSAFDLIIGGPHGLHCTVLDRADEKMSLSYLTFPHDLAKIVVAEQIYRALSIMNNFPYHK